MDLFLSDRDQASFALVVDACLAASTASDAWITETLTSLMSIVGADKAALWLPRGDMGNHVQVNHESNTFEQYPARLDSLARTLSLYQQHVRLGVYSRRQLWHPHYDTMLKSAYYNDYILPKRCHDAIGISIHLEGPVGANTVAQLLLHHDSPHGRRFGERELAILRMVYPVVRRAAKLHACRTPSFILMTEQELSHAGLTAREIEVVCLIVREGASNKALARRLSISVHTARHHVERAMSKLGVTSRTRLATRVSTAA